MAMSEELKKRVVTGGTGALALLLLVIFGGKVGIYLITAVLVLGMLYEYGKIVFRLPDAVEKRYALLTAGWFAVVIDALSPRSEYELSLLSFFFFGIYFLVTARRYPTGRFIEHFREMTAAMFGLLYLGLIPLFLPRLHEGPSGVRWTILFLLLVWAGDTGAYFAGKKYGRRKLYPEISPKKTIEGSLGGLAAGLVVAILYKVTVFTAMKWGAVLFVPLLVGPVAQAGDLFESFLKRAFDVKDSGTILPGHGGFMDRFDAVVFALPVMYATVRVFG